MVCTSLGSLLRPLFYFLCYIHFSLSVQRVTDIGTLSGNGKNVTITLSSDFTVKYIQFLEQLTLRIHYQ